MGEFGSASSVSDPIEALRPLTPSRTASYGVRDDPLREEILIVAGDLETDQPHPKHTWEYLSRLIDELGNQLRLSEN